MPVEWIGKIGVTSEERQRFADLVDEAVNHVKKFRSSFPSTSHGFMLFTLACGVISRRLEETNMTSEETRQHVMEWIVAGEPEELGVVPDRLMERMRRTDAG